jgi:plastocyanin
MYYISDLNGGQQSTIEIVKPYVAPPPAPVYVEPIVEEQVENFTVKMTQNGFSQNNLVVNEGDSVTFVNTHNVTDINLEPHAISDPFAVPYTVNSYYILDDSTTSQTYTISNCDSYEFHDRFFDVEPITVQCNVEKVLENSDDPKYQTTIDGITTVDVFTIPFDVTITENGSVTVHNTDSVEHVVSHTGTTGTTKSGTFYKVIPAQQQATIEFPITGSTIYESGVYTFEDTVTGKSGSVTVTPWIGSQQMIQDNTVTGVSQSTAEQVGIQEDIVVVLKQESTPESIVDEGIYNVPKSKTNMDLITLQTQLATVTAQFNDSITKLADQKVAIENHDSQVQSLTT